MLIFKKCGKSGVTLLFAVMLMVLGTVVPFGFGEAANAADPAGQKDPVAAFRLGVDAHKRGDGEAAVKAFEYASSEGILGAQLYLGRMFAQGDLVAKDSGKAFDHYFRLVRGFNHLTPHAGAAKYVAEAYVAVGKFYEHGLPERGIPVNLSRAARFYGHAASYFRDPAAQFRLARLHLKEGGIGPNVSVAAKWLHSAAKKNYAPAQAVLADILWAEGPFQRPVQALALIELARKNAAGPASVWIGDMYDKLYAKATKDNIGKAQTLVARWEARNTDRMIAKAEGGRRPAPIVEDPWPFQPQVVSVILGQPGVMEVFDADSLFESASTFEGPQFDTGGARFIEAGAFER